MQHGGFTRSLLSGVLIGLVLIAAVVGYLLWQDLQESGTAGANDVIVMLVLPDEEGVVLPRTIDRYVTSGGETTVDHIDVRKKVEIPGTTYTQLRDAYSFQGPAGVAASVSKGDLVPTYVVIDLESYSRLMGEEPISIDIPEHMEVFDGQHLTTFEQGKNEISDEQITALFQGLQYLDDGAREDVRAQVGEAIARRLAAEPSAGTWLETSLTAEEYPQFVDALGKVVAE